MQGDMVSATICLLHVPCLLTAHAGRCRVSWHGYAATATVGNVGSSRARPMSRPCLCLTSSGSRSSLLPASSSNSSFTSSTLLPLDTALPVKGLSRGCAKLHAHNTACAVSACASCRPSCVLSCHKCLHPCCPLARSQEERTRHCVCGKHYSCQNTPTQQTIAGERERRRGERGTGGGGRHRHAENCTEAGAGFAGSNSLVSACLQSGGRTTQCLQHGRTLLSQLQGLPLGRFATRQVQLQAHVCLQECIAFGPELL